ncbi:MAG: DNA repair and recombination protein RadB [Candidatus Altiarchaeota archaeon]|nr:DNA repair and recombination protein RadB [Candidatus Altiarchaeota archaeon]
MSEYRGAEKFRFNDLTEFLPKTITQIYGGPATGKTNLCLYATVKEVQKGNKVIFIDTEGSFSPQRLKQICGEGMEEATSNIILAEPSDFDEQKIAVNKLEDLMIKNKVGLIVVDSLVSLYRLEMGTSEDAYALNREMGKQLAQLLKISKKYKIPVVATNQVYATFEKGKESSKTVPVGRDLLKYWTKIVIELKKEGSFRVATLVRHKFKPEGSSLRFKINDSGVEEV